MKHENKVSLLLGTIFFLLLLRISFSVLPWLIHAWKREARFPSVNGTSLRSYFFVILFCFCLFNESLWFRKRRRRRRKKWKKKNNIHPSGMLSLNRHLRDWDNVIELLIKHYFSMRHNFDTMRPPFSDTNLSFNILVRPSNEILLRSGNSAPHRHKCVRCAGKKKCIWSINVWELDQSTYERIDQDP